MRYDGPIAVKAWHQSGSIYVEIDDGRTVSFPASENEYLADATHEQRNHIEISAFGLHWPDLDEDLSTAGILAGRYGRPKRGGKRKGAGRKPKGNVRVNYYVTPETKERIAALAKQKGISQSAVIDQLVAKA